MNFWYAKSQEVIQAVLRGLPPDATDAAKLRAINDAYPFGTRQRRPYKEWLRARKAAIHSGMKTKPAATKLNLFSDFSTPKHGGS